MDTELPKGFDPAQTRGMGLIGMQERVKCLGGILQIQSRPGQGTVLTVELPLATEGAFPHKCELYEQNPHLAGR